MSEQTTSNVPTWFRIVAWVTLVWNLLGVMNFVMQATMSPEALNSFPQEMRDYIATRPFWVTAAFAIGVFAGALGCGTLIMRKKLSVSLLALSLVAVVLTQLHFFFIGKPLSFVSVGQLIPVLVTIPIAIYLVFLVRFATQKGWIC